MCYIFQREFETMDAACMEYLSTDSQVVDSWADIAQFLGLSTGSIFIIREGDHSSEVDAAVMITMASIMHPDGLKAFVKALWAAECYSPAWRLKSSVNLFTPTGKLDAGTITFLSHDSGILQNWRKLGLQCGLSPEDITRLDEALPCPVYHPATMMLELLAERKMPYADFVVALDKSGCRATFIALHKALNCKCRPSTKRA